MPKLKQHSKALWLVTVSALALVSACDSRHVDEEVPVPVSVFALRWHSTSIPERLLELRGYYSKQTGTGVPHFFSTEMDAQMSNLAGAIPVSFVPQNKMGSAGCFDGYAKAYGYFDSEDLVFRVFVMSLYDAEWQETSPCWSTNFDWENDPELSQLTR